NASDEAYQLGAPDAPISAVVYGLTMVLATAGGTEKTGRPPALDLLLGGALLANAGGAANYLVNMITEQKKVCLYCVAGAAINFASLAVAWPDLREGVRRIFG
ncbi:MAG: vitamin K epoxide reductase family protein, partial [Tunicatimonas sp.]